MSAAAKIPEKKGEIVVTQALADKVADQLVKGSENLKMDIDEFSIVAFQIITDWFKAAGVEIRVSQETLN